MLRTAPAGVTRQGWSLLYLPSNFDARSSPIRLARWDDKDTGPAFIVGQDIADEPSSLAARDGGYVFFLKRQADVGRLPKFKAGAWGRSRPISGNGPIG